jgi:hypothetical protein
MHRFDLNPQSITPHAARTPTVFNDRPKGPAPDRIDRSIRALVRSIESEAEAGAGKVELAAALSLARPSVCSDSRSSRCVKSARSPSSIESTEKCL